MDQTTAIGILYPAMHKFYNALKSLSQFNKGNNFFDNISYLDNFFSEYRNITFVLQKSLAHSEYKRIYEENRTKHLLNETCKWFVDKRNEVTKQHPFNLEKRIAITLYHPKTSIALPEYIFTIENDKKCSSIINSLRKLLARVNPIEVFFSVEFSFYEKNQNKELYDNLISGINSMKIFMSSMKEAINEKCTLYNELEHEINKMSFYQVPKSMLFIDDFAYYPQEDHFEKASRIKMITPNFSSRTPISKFCYFLKKDKIEKRNYFNDFILLHIAIFTMQKKMMPTFMIIYDDETFELKSFDASIKTTIYRTINEITNKIEQDKIKSIFYVCEMLTYYNDSKYYEELLKMKSKDRSKHKTSELLCFFQLNCKLHSQSRYFESDKVFDMKYVSHVLKSESRESFHINFLQPIINEFKRLNKNIIND